MSDVTLKHEAFEVYKKAFNLQEQNMGGNGLDNCDLLPGGPERIQTLVIQFLCLCQPGQRFEYKEFSSILLLSSDMEYFDPGKAAQAFLNLEQYILLLCLMPWKQEFHKLKKYCGYFQTKIESHLANAESIFRLIGFRDFSPGMLQLAGPALPLEQLLKVAFECLVAAWECKIMEDVWKRTEQFGVSPKDIVWLRKSMKGSVDNMVTHVSHNYKPLKNTGSVTDSSDQFNQIDSHVKTRRKEEMPDVGIRKSSAIGNESVSDRFRNKLNIHLENVRHIENDMEDIPFIDDNLKDAEYEPGNLDDHLLESLRMVENDSNTLDGRADTKASQEWSFVKEGLEQKFGKKYFEGPRKDILNEDKSTTTPSSGGYVKVIARDPNHKYVNFGDVRHPDNKYNDVYTPASNYVQDSAYSSGANTSYPPSLTSKGPAQLSQGVQRLAQQPDARQTVSEPIKKRHSQPPPPPAHAAPNYSYAMTPAAPNMQVTPSAPPANMENIQRLQKQSSLGAQSQRMLPRDSQLPGLQRNVSGGMRSHSEVITRQNLPETNFNGANTVNIPVRSPTSTEPGQKMMNYNKSYAKPYQQNKWPCAHCTYLNDASDRVCTMCARSREHLDTDSPPMPGQTSKVCPQCTLENGMQAESCHACGHGLKATQTVV